MFVNKCSFLIGSGDVGMDGWVVTVDLQVKITNAFPMGWNVCFGCQYRHDFRVTRLFACCKYLPRKVFVFQAEVTSKNIQGRYGTA